MVTKLEVEKGNLIIESTSYLENKEITRTDYLKRTLFIPQYFDCTSSSGEQMKSKRWRIKIVYWRHSHIFTTSLPFLVILTVQMAQKLIYLFKNLCTYIFFISVWLDIVDIVICILTKMPFCFLDGIRTKIFTSENVLWIVLIFSYGSHWNATAVIILS